MEIKNSMSNTSKKVSRTNKYNYKSFLVEKNEEDSERSGNREGDTILVLS